MARHELQWLLKDAQKLEHIIAEGERFLEKAPAGTLQIRPHNQGVQYYHRPEKETRSGIYLPKKNMILIKGLAQKRYFEKVLPVAYKQLKEIQRFLENYDPDALKVVYQKEGMERQKLIRAVDIPDALFAEAWLAQEYEHKAFTEDTPSHFTQKNERVRSKSEVLIADALYRAGIPYKYECPLKVRGQIIYPDFTILREYDRAILYWEHQGLMDEADYRNHAIQRVHDYEAEGIFPGERLIITT